jgi:hypothetical protein
MLPATFRFSQGSLQDFVDCPRRFQLRYVQSQVWPAVVAEPVFEVERHLDRGVRFHRLIQRHQLGVDEKVLGDSVRDDPELLAWWERYLAFDFLHGLGGRRFPEVSLSVSLGVARLVAVFDLLVVSSDRRIYIFDWKTYSRFPGRDWLRLRLQTRVYPLVCVLAGSALLGVDVVSENVSLVYWVVSASDPVVFSYDEGLFEEDRLFLSGLVGRVLRMAGDVWPLTRDHSRCKFCEYRSLCERGGVVGDLLVGSNEFDNISGGVGGLSWLGGVDLAGFGK